MCESGLPQCFSNNSNYLDFVESEVSVGFSYENNRYYYNNNYSVASSDKVLSGYTVLNQAGQQLTGSMPNNGDVTIAPTTSEQVKEKGYYNSLKVSAVTSAIDSNITPENIKKDISILGVTGTLEGGIDTSDANATANDIIQGKTAYVNGEKINGAIGTVYSSELSDTYITRNMINNRPLGGYFITISPDGNYLFFVTGRTLSIYKYIEEVYINTGITYLLDMDAASIVNCSALDENNNYYIITSRTSLRAGGYVLKFNINDNTIVSVDILNLDEYNKDIVQYSRDISTKYICAVNATNTISDEYNYYNMCISAISDLDSHIVNVNCVAPNNTSNIKAKTVNIINDNCFIMQQIGLIGTDEYVKSTDLTIINSSTNEFIKNTHIEGSFVPNKSLTYAIVDNNIKSIFIDVDTGSYNVLESTSIIIPNYTSSCLVKWLDDSTIICGDYITGVVNVYDIDIITNTINPVVSITTLSGNNASFDRTFNMFFVGPSFVGNSNEFGNNNAFVKLQEGEQKTCF